MLGKIFKIIFIVVATLGFMFLINIFIFKASTKSGVEKIVEGEKIRAENELVKNGESAPNPSAHIPPFGSWQIYNYPDLGFSITLPSKPSIRTEYARNFEQETTFLVNTSVPGENIKYVVWYYKDKNMSLDFLQKIYKFVFGDLMTFFNTVKDHVSNIETVEYTATTPKYNFGKMIVVGEKAYVIGAQCLYCTEVPEFDNFIKSFSLINN